MVSTGRTSLPLAIAIVAGVGYMMVMGAALLLPETKGMDLGQAGGDDSAHEPSGDADKTVLAPTVGKLA